MSMYFLYTTTWIPLDVVGVCPCFTVQQYIQNWESQRVSQYNPYDQAPELQIQLLRSCLLMRLPTLLVTTKTVQPYRWTEAVCSCRVPESLCHVLLPKLSYSRWRVRFVSLLLSWGGQENFRIATTSIPEHWLSSSTFETSRCRTCHIADNASVLWACCWVEEDGRISELRRRQFPNTYYQVQRSKRLVTEPAI